MKTPDEQKTQFYAEVGRLTMATAVMDNQLTILLSRLMSNEQTNFDYGFASIFMFSARSIQQRTEILKKSFIYRCGHLKSLRKQDNRRRAYDWTEKALNKCTANMEAHRWVRNTAAHGSFFLHDGRITLVPAMLDIEGQKRLKERGSEYANGLTLQHLEEATANAKADKSALGKLTHVFWSLLAWQEDPSLMMQRANVLAPDLKMPKLHLQDPRDGPPKRGRRRNPGG